MKLTVEVIEQGILRIKTPNFKPGQEIVLETQEEIILDSDKGKWSEIDKILAKADDLDFPRRTHEEIIRDLHDIRG